MRTLVLGLVAVLLLGGCNGGNTDSAKTDDSGPVVAKSTGSEGGQTKPSVTDSGSTSTNADTTGGSHDSPTASNGSAKPDKPDKPPVKSEPGTTTGGSTTATPTRSTYVGDYKLTQGLGAEATMFMLTLKEDGTCKLQTMKAGAASQPDPKEGKWKESGGQVMIELPGESPLIATLKDREMVSEQFDKAHWKGRRLIFYKR